MKMIRGMAAWPARESVKRKQLYRLSVALSSCLILSVTYPFAMVYRRYRAPLVQLRIGGQASGETPFPLVLNLGWRTVSQDQTLKRFHGRSNRFKEDCRKRDRAKQCDRSGRG